MCEGDRENPSVSDLVRCSFLRNPIRSTPRNTISVLRVVGWPSALVLLALGCANSTNTSSDDSLAETHVVASVDGEEIRGDEVDALIKERLFEEQFGEGSANLYEARRAVIDEMVRERLVARAAEAAGQDSEVWLAAAAAARPPVSDEEVLGFFEENRAQLPPGASFETFAERIRSYLEARRAENVITDLEAGAIIQVTLQRERALVEAIGPSRGPASAPVTIVEFSDFQCPYCARVGPTLDQLLERYPDQIRIVFRHLPLAFHEQARLAAQASFCAEGAGLFWEYHDQLFANQRALQRSQLIDYASLLELDTEAFETCMDSPEAQARVDADLAAAEALGATGTPAFFINGIGLSGAQPLEAFEAIISEELAARDG